MRQIDLFVDSLYQDVRDNKNEIVDLKAEMRNHLLEAFHELKTEGNLNRKRLN